VSDLPPPTPADDPALALRTEARIALDAAKAILAAPVFEKQYPIALLMKFATDDRVPRKEQLRAMQTLAHLHLRAVEIVAELTGAKEQRLKDLGIETAPQEVHVEQHNTRIEIVREGAKDWRTVEGG